ncbi:MAG: TIGR00730 family Rossman fold protein [Pseudomonadota bacterium]|nr:TIGR00730 family Rossman fold protein [Pseudomonadota bacterium]
MSNFRAAAVFCGAQPGDDPAFRAAAAELGRGIAEAGIRLIFGGGRVGLMGAVADAALGAGGQVTGVIPEFLTRLEIAHGGVSEMVVTDSMHARKQRMFELADAFIALPGGLGTLDETVEIITWRQLRLHDKPILLCNVAGSAAPLLAAIEAAVARGFAEPRARRLFEVLDGVPSTLARLNALRIAGIPGSEATDSSQL